LHVALVETLLCIDSEHKWNAIFPTEEHTKNTLAYLLMLSETSSIPALLKAAQIQALAHFLGCEWLRSSEMLQEGTTSLIFASSAETNLTVQVRNSQATKELAESLLAGDEEAQTAKL